MRLILSKQRTPPFLGEGGFTLLELMVVFAVIGMLSVIGVISLVAYSKTQQLNSETQSVATTLHRAKSRAQSQVKPGSCGAAELEGYKVVFCASTGCSTYQTYVVCGPDIAVGPQQKLAEPVDFEAPSRPDFFFRVLTQESNAGTIVVRNGTLRKTITVDSLGGISVSQ